VLCSRIRCDKARENGFKLRGQIWIAHKEDDLYNNGSEALHRLPREVVVPHPCRHPWSGDGAVSTDGAVGIPVLPSKVNHPMILLFENRLSRP